MQKIELKIVGLSYSHSQSSAYALILGEVNGNRRLPIIVGGLEAQAIAIEVEKLKPARPLTHDLFKTFAETFDIEIREVIINKFHEGIFYSILVCEKNGNIIEIDSRTSDAVAIALRFNSPIYTYESIMSVGGIVLDPEDETIERQMDTEVEENEFSVLSNSELDGLLLKSIEKEDYERASEIRDEIEKRKK
ncbi:MAG: bifunctional nuclease family protein [Bacteroidales bacterium]|jgi:bifunctional DNase/RNase|nr:bifunctional nuclease family protein [Bacteroidales bacterium]